MVCFFCSRYVEWLRVSKCIQYAFICAYIASWRNVSIYLKHGQAQSSCSIFMFMELFMKPLLIQDVSFKRNPKLHNHSPLTEVSIHRHSHNTSKYPNHHRFPANVRSSVCACALAMFTSSVTSASQYGALWQWNLTSVHCFSSHFKTCTKKNEWNYGPQNEKQTLKLGALIEVSWNHLTSINGRWLHNNIRGLTI
jgi:hypothetical protein